MEQCKKCPILDHAPCNLLQLLDDLGIESALKCSIRNGAELLQETAYHKGISWARTNKMARDYTNERKKDN